MGAAVGRWVSIGALWNKRTGRRLSDGQVSILRGLLRDVYLSLDPETLPDVLQHAEPMRNGQIALQLFPVDPAKAAGAQNPPIADLSIKLPRPGEDKSEVL